MQVTRQGMLLFLLCVYHIHLMRFLCKDAQEIINMICFGKRTWKWQTLNFLRIPVFIVLGCFFFFFPPCVYMAFLYQEE